MIIEVAFTSFVVIIPVILLMKNLKAERFNLEAANQKLKRSHEQLSNIFDNLDVAIWSLDGVHHSLQVSAGIEKIFGVPRETFTNNPERLWKDMIHPQDREKAANMHKALRAGKASLIEYRIRTPQDRIVWIQDRGVPLSNPEGRIIRMDGVFIDVTESKHAFEKLNKMAYFDPLTELPNRRHFEKAAQEALDRTATEETGMLAVFFLDLDGFKKVNDTLGHDGGDLLLKEVAGRIQSCVPKKGIAARIAGDEFAVLLPDCGQDEALFVADDLIASLQHPIQIHEHFLIVTPSIGIAFFPAHGTDYPTLVKHADDAMYEAKHQGKNHYRVYSS